MSSTEELNLRFQLDEAGIISTSLEAILYGFSVFMFGATIWVLFRRRATPKVNVINVIVATSLFVFTDEAVWQHIAIDIRRLVEGFIINKSLPTALWFEDISRFTFVFKNAIYAAQTLVGNGIIIFRLWVVWQTCVGGRRCLGMRDISTRDGGIFHHNTYAWISAFYGLAFATNLIVTLLLILRIWQVNSKAAGILVFSVNGRRAGLLPVMLVIIDGAVPYSIALLAAFVAFMAKSNGQFVVLDMIMPIISIAFYIVLIRVGLAREAIFKNGLEANARGIPPTHPNGSTRVEYRTEFPLRPMEVHITHLTETQKDLQGIEQESSNDKGAYAGDGAV
ncbi:hypothetical protein OF83DRAFT_1083427 [Amylostereum chailletii]|nr:hypothetical protein OF83DRAFT_1083427 [Amylostereum chailletii]